MGDVVLWMGISVDGYIEAPGHDIDWHLVDDELHTYFNERLGAAGAFLEGRVVFELMQAFWPNADEDPEGSPTMDEFAGIWRRIPKIVYSRTLQSVPEGATAVVHDVVPDEVRALKGTYEGDLILGGAGIGAAFLALDLVDEIATFVHPVVLGAGTPLFPLSDQRHGLRLVESRAFTNGVVMLRYARR